MPLLLSSCAPKIEYCELAPETQIPVTSEFTAQETAKLEELVQVDFGLIESLVPGWLCHFDSLQFSVQQEDEDYAGLYNPGSSTLEVNVLQNDVDILMRGDYESREYLDARSRLRYVFLHEMGHHVSSWFISDQDAIDFGKFSWDYAGNFCNKAADQAAEDGADNYVSNGDGAVPLQFMQGCFSLTSDAATNDFIGNDYSGYAYGAKNLAEDWAQTFGMAVQNIMENDPDYDRDLMAISESYYSDVALQKLDWMYAFIYSARDDWQKKNPTTSTEVEFSE